MKATTLLTDFLLARIAEDEAVARRHSPHWRDGDGLYGVCTSSGSNDEGADDSDTDIAVAPARVLAECEAKRRIVGLHPEILTICQGCANESYPCRTLVALAAVYSDHPDYREEWRP